MRMINDLNNILGVDEVVGLDATPLYTDTDTEDNPESFVVSTRIPAVGDIDSEWLGEYSLDGTEETYREAVKNFNDICLFAAINGYFRLSDFKNFQMY